MKTKPEKDNEFRMKSEDFDRLMRGALGAPPRKKTASKNVRQKRAEQKK